MSTAVRRPGGGSEPSAVLEELGLARPELGGGALVGPRGGGPAPDWSVRWKGKPRGPGWSAGRTRRSKRAGSPGPREVQRPLATSQSTTNTNATPRRTRPWTVAHHTDHWPPAKLARPAQHNAGPDWQRRGVVPAQRTSAGPQSDNKTQLLSSVAPASSQSIQTPALTALIYKQPGRQPDPARQRRVPVKQ